MKWISIFLLSTMTACDGTNKSNPDHSGFVSYAGSKLYFEDAGNGDAIVFLHGGLTDHRMWSHQTEALKDKFRVVTVDLRGHGAVSYTHLTLPTIYSV